MRITRRRDGRLVEALEKIAFDEEGREAKPADRLKAIEMLGKITGLMAEKKPAQAKPPTIIDDIGGDDEASAYENAARFHARKPLERGPISENPAGFSGRNRAGGNDFSSAAQARPLEKSPGTGKADARERSGDGSGGDGT